MATYKVIQDIEAEDKLLGPLSLRQFIYTAIVAVSAFIAFKLAAVAWWLVLPMIPHMILFGLLAAPFGHDQSSEVWLLAKIRFLLKPRKRIWDQSGVKELVTITAPKKIERVLTKNLTQTEVRSRLQALANTIDSRGWAIKNVNMNLYTHPSYALSGTSDRLIDPSQIPQEVPNYDVGAVKDMLDEQNDPTAIQLDSMMQASAQNHRQQIIAQMQQGSTASPVATPPADYWFMNSSPTNQTQPAPGYAAFDHSSVVAPGQTTPVASAADISKAEEAALLEKIHAEQAKPDPTHSHLRVIEPLSAQHHSAPHPTPAPPTPAVAPKPAMKAAPDPAILELANNDDLNIATIARQANKAASQKLPDGEVVISLH